MGVYQLISPITALSFSLCSAAYQTAISKLVAERSVKKGQHVTDPILAGFLFTLPLSLLCCVLLYHFAPFLSECFLHEKRTAELLKIFALSIPFCSAHSCINGYFYGKKNATVPALIQIFEQLVRVSCVFLLASMAKQNGTVPLTIAVAGITVSEVASFLLVAIVYRRILPNEPKNKEHRQINSTLKSLLAMAMPLTANRLVLNILQSIEAVSIPDRLRIYGHSSSEALRIYGVLNGMAMPFLFFPNALIGSLSVLLLPMISEQQASGNQQQIKKATHRTVKYCLCMGFVCLALFFCIGPIAGTYVFHSQLAGYFIRTLGFICPFLYLDITLSSILQGLGMVGKIFFANTFCLFLRLLFVFFLVPKIGISGYLWGLLVSQIVLSLLLLWFVKDYEKQHT